MNCNTFRDRLEDFVEGNLSYDLKSVMITHMENCKECSELYKQEVKIERDFSMAYSTEGVEFKSCRQDIIKQIDGERYIKNRRSRVAVHLREYGKAYAGMAAVLLAFLIFGTHIAVSPKSTQSRMSTDSETTVKSANSDNAPQIQKGINVDNKTVGNIKFTMKNIDSKSSVSAVEWKNSPDNNYSACIEGGPENVDFGIRKIYLRNLKSNKLISFSMDQTSGKQDTPMFLDWWGDSKYILIIVGNAYGTVSKGGSVYALDIITGIGYTVYTASGEQQVRNIKVGNAGVTCDILVYEDNNFTQYHVVSYYISQNDISSILARIKAEKPK